MKGLTSNKTTAAHHSRAGRRCRPPAAGGGASEVAVFWSRKRRLRLRCRPRARHSDARRPGGFRGGQVGGAGHAAGLQHAAQPGGYAHEGPALTDARASRSRGRSMSPSRGPAPDWPPARAPARRETWPRRRSGSRTGWSCRFPARCAEFLVQAIARDLVERPERLVHQQEPRPAEPVRGRWIRAGACRRRVRAERPFPSLQAPPARAARAASAARATCAAADLERQLDVLQRGAPGQQRRILEDEADVAALARPPAASSPSTRPAALRARSGRRRPAAAWTCRSPTGRAGSGTRPRAT